eukprot:1139967-Prymnesium_polylepis.1
MVAPTCAWPVGWRAPCTSRRLFGRRDHRRVRCCCRTSGDAIFPMWRTARRSASVVPGKCVR